MKLVYIGPAPADVGCVPVPEGWSASDHEEPDPALAAVKVASGLYRREPPAKPDKPAPSGDKE